MIELRVFRVALRLAFPGVLLLAGLGVGAASGQTTRRWSLGVGVNANTMLEGQWTRWGGGATAELVRRGDRFEYGVELGYQAFGTQVTLIENFDNRPGWIYQEEFSRSMIRLAGIARIQIGTGTNRPYLVLGAGGYDGRFKDRIHVRDQTDQRVPFYEFSGSGSDVKPGVTAGAGIVLGRVLGRAGLAFEGRWHGIFDVTEDGFGTADFLSLGIALRW